MIKVNEIFYSIQGESSYAGYPCVFIRLTGCNLRCSYCDTKYAYKNGNSMNIDRIVEIVERYECPLVEITGGEPLIQEETPVLVNSLLERGYKVLVETNGTKNINVLAKDAVCILDIKCPASGESDKTDWDNIYRLGPGDEVKFVLSNIDDYEWAKEIIRKYKLTDRAVVHFSPLLGSLEPAEIAKRILNDWLNVHLQVQLHKIIWPEENRGR